MLPTRANPISFFCFYLLAKSKPIPATHSTCIEDLETVGRITIYCDVGDLESWLTDVRRLCIYGNSREFGDKDSSFEIRFLGFSFKLPSNIQIIFEGEDNKLWHLSPLLCIHYDSFSFRLNSLSLSHWNLCSVYEDPSLSFDPIRRFVFHKFSNHKTSS